MDSSDWTPQRVLAELRDGAIVDEQDDGALAGLACRALFLLARGHRELEAPFDRFYAALARRVTTEVRRRIFERVRAHTRRGLLRGEVLVPFLRLEGERCIVAGAAFEAGRLGVAAPLGGPRGADLVLDLVAIGATVNPGAALGGLLALASKDVNAKIKRLRPELAASDADAALAEMTWCARGYVHAATVRFWLEWMEALACELPTAQRVFDRTADALVALREAIGAPFVYEGSWVVLPQRFGVRSEPGAQEIPVSRFAASIGPRLVPLARAAPGSRSLQRALAVWGVAQ
jgi:hypothetical protein